MKAQSDLAQKFQLLHQEEVHSYEQQVKLAKENIEKNKTHSEKRQQQLREIMRKSHIDMDAIEKMEREDVAMGKKYIQETRPALLSNIGHAKNSREKLVLRSSVTIPGQITAPLFGSTLLATNHKSLEGNPGEKGNPWVLPWNPGQVRINAIDDLTGGDSSDWGCGYFFGDPTFGAYNAQAVFFFPFTPTVEGYWYITSYINLSGFYVLYANDSWWNCKNIKASVDAYVDIYQYFWNGQKHFPLLNIDADNISTNQIFSDFLAMDYQVALKTTDWAFVKVTIKISAFARGVGSFSEVNFSDGTQNFIEPLAAIAVPL
jgi:hypothetical protein